MYVSCGAVSDGHDYVAQAAEKGAAAVVVQKDVAVDGSVAVIRTEDTRLALAEMSAAYFGHPAMGTDYHRHHRDKGKDDRHIYGALHLRAFRL